MNAFERWSVRLTSLAVIVTGFAILWFQYGVESPDPFAVVNHPLQIWALKGHVLVAPLFVLAIGFISVRHIWRHIVRGVEPGRRSGLLTIAAIVPMVASGYLIQVVVSEGLRTVIVWTHIGSSVVFTVGVGFHLVLMWRYLRKLRTETFCAQVRMGEQLGVTTEYVRGDREPRTARPDDERDPAERDLAETGRPA